MMVGVWITPETVDSNVEKKKRRKNTNVYLEFKSDNLVSCSNRAHDYLIVIIWEKYFVVENIKIYDYFCCNKISNVHVCVRIIIMCL